MCHDYRSETEQLSASFTETHCSLISLEDWRKADQNFVIFVDNLPDPWGFMKSQSHGNLELSFVRIYAGVCLEQNGGVFSKMMIDEAAETFWNFLFAFVCEKRVCHIKE